MSHDDAVLAIYHYLNDNKLINSRYIKADEKLIKLFDLKKNPIGSEGHHLIGWCPYLEKGKPGIMFSLINIDRFVTKHIPDDFLVKKKIESAQFKDNISYSFQYRSIH